MKRVNRIVSAIVLICFLFNTALSDLAFGQMAQSNVNVNHLAAGLFTDDILGGAHEIQAMIKAKVEFGLTDYLKHGRKPPTLANLKKHFLDNPQKDTTGIQIFWQEAYPLTRGFCVRCRAEGKPPATYHVIFSLGADDNGGLPVIIYDKAGIPEPAKEAAESDTNATSGAKYDATVLARTISTERATLLATALNAKGGQMAALRENDIHYRGTEEAEPETGGRRDVLTRDSDKTATSASNAAAVIDKWEAMAEQHEVSKVSPSQFLTGRPLEEQERLEAIIDEIITAVDLASEDLATVKIAPDEDAIRTNRFVIKPREGAVKTTDFYVVPEKTHDGWSLSVAIYVAKHYREISIYRELIERYDWLQSIMSPLWDTDMRDKQREVMYNILMANARHEVGHGFVNSAGYDLYTLLNDEKARKDFAHIILGIKDTPKTDTEIKLFAEALANLLIGGKDVKEYVEMEAARRFYEIICTVPETYATGIDEKMVRKLVHDYYFDDGIQKERRYIRLVLPIICIKLFGTRDIDKLVEAVTAKTIEDYRAFFGEGTPWYERMRGQENGDEEELAEIPAPAVAEIEKLARKCANKLKDARETARGALWEYIKQYGDDRVIALIERVAAEEKSGDARTYIRWTVNTLRKRLAMNKLGSKSTTSASKFDAKEPGLQTAKPGELSLQRITITEGSSTPIGDGFYLRVLNFDRTMGIFSWIEHDNAQGSRRSIVSEARCLNGDGDTITTFGNEIRVRFKQYLGEGRVRYEIIRSNASPQPAANIMPVLGNTLKLLVYGRERREEIRDRQRVLYRKLFNILKSWYPVDRFEKVSRGAALESGDILFSADGVKHRFGPFIQTQARTFDGTLSGIRMINGRTVTVTFEEQLKVKTKNILRLRLNEEDVEKVRPLLDETLNIEREQFDLQLTAMRPVAAAKRVSVNDVKLSTIRSTLDETAALSLAEKLADRIAVLDSGVCGKIYGLFTANIAPDRVKKLQSAEQIKNGTILLIAREGEQPEFYIRIGAATNSAFNFVGITKNGISTVYVTYNSLAAKGASIYNIYSSILNPVVQEITASAKPVMNATSASKFDANGPSLPSARTHTGSAYFLGYIRGKAAELLKIHPEDISVYPTTDPTKFSVEITINDAVGPFSFKAAPIKTYHVDVAENGEISFTEQTDRQQPMAKAQPGTTATSASKFDANGPTKGKATPERPDVVSSRSVGRAANRVTKKMIREWADQGLGDIVASWLHQGALAREARTAKKSSAMRLLAERLLAGNEEQEGSKAQATAKEKPGTGATSASKFDASEPKQQAVETPVMAELLKDTFRDGEFVVEYVLSDKIEPSNSLKEIIRAELMRFIEHSERNIDNMPITQGATFYYGQGVQQHYYVAAYKYGDAVGFRITSGTEDTPDLASGTIKNTVKIADKPQALSRLAGSAVLERIPRHHPRVWVDSSQEFGEGVLSAAGKQPPAAEKKQKINPAPDRVVAHALYEVLRTTLRSDIRRIDIGQVSLSNPREIERYLKTPLRIYGEVTRFLEERGRYTRKYVPENRPYAMLLDAYLVVMNKAEMQHLFKGRSENAAFKVLDAIMAEISLSYGGDKQDFSKAPSVKSHEGAFVYGDFGVSYTLSDQVEPSEYLRLTLWTAMTKFIDYSNMNLTNMPKTNGARFDYDDGNGRITYDIHAYEMGGGVVGFTIGRNAGAIQDFARGTIRYIAQANPSATDGKILHLQHLIDHLTRRLNAAIATREEVGDIEEETDTMVVGLAREKDAEIAQIHQELEGLQVRLLGLLDRQALVAVNTPASIEAIISPFGPDSEWQEVEDVSGPAVKRVVALPRTDQANAAAEIKEVTDKHAVNVGLAVPTAEETRYKLIVDNSLLTGDERVGDIKGFVAGNGKSIGAADRFGLETANTSDVNNILAHVTDPIRTIVQVSCLLTDGQLKELREKAPGIRVIRADTTFFRSDSAMNANERRLCRFDMYARMLALRRITAEDIRERNSIYMVSKFYVKTCLEGDAADVDKYLEAIVTGNIESAVFIIHHNLSYRPIEKWQQPDYHLVAITLISA